MSDTKKRHDDWDEPDDERDEPLPDRKRRRSVPTDERAEYEAWRSERGSRGRKRRDKAGGRHETSRLRRSDG
jgi:hypothetical protein